jgi:hypothetical protein
VLDFECANDAKLTRERDREDDLEEEAGEAGDGKKDDGNCCFGVAFGDDGHDDEGESADFSV